MITKINVLVTGASGRVGYRVVEQLYKKTDLYTITAFDLKTRKSVKRLSKFKDKISIVYGTINQTEILKEICINKDVVIHLAAIIPPLAEDQPQLAKTVNISGTKNIVTILETYAPNAFFMYSSSISVYADRILNPYIKVGDEIKANPIGDEYTKTKIAAEKIIQESSLNWTIFRLCGVMGEHKISRLMFSMPLKTPMEITTASDAARAFVNGIQQQKALSKTIFNLGGGEQMRITYEDFLSRSFKIMGLGAVNFPKKHFAEKNFHGGHYIDSDQLEAILHFRKDSLESYFQEFSNSKSSVEKSLISVLKKPIKYFLAKMSVPRKISKSGNRELIATYFLQ